MSRVVLYRVRSISRNSGAACRVSRRLAWVLLASGILGFTQARADDPTPEITVDHDDIEVTSNVRLKQGPVRVVDKNGDGVIHVTADHVTLDLGGITLDGSVEGQAPETYEGIGISVRKARDVSVVGGSVRGFRVGIRAEDAPGLRLENVTADQTRCMRLRSTPAREDEADWLWPHENDDGQWEARYGGGFSLTRCPGARVVGCRAEHGQNGLLLSRCDGARVHGSDFSWNSGWGIGLWRTSEGTFQGNTCDFCVRGYSHGVYARGQDSAGFLVFEQCSRNEFRDNSATHSGDGFFLYAGNETLKKTGAGGCNDNEVVGNDFSHAVANGIEATFSTGNRFVRNRCDDCDHGVWAGYSYVTRISGNTFRDCAHGVSIEHGQRNMIVGNEFTRCGEGIRLWTDEDADLKASPFGRARDTVSRANRIEHDAFEGCGTAIVLDGDVGSTIDLVQVVDGKVGLETRGDTRDLTLAHSLVRVAPGGIHVRALGGTRVDGTELRLEGEPRLEGDVKPPPAFVEGFARPYGPTEAAGPSGPDLPVLPAYESQGDRRLIVIGEHGPVHPSITMLIPRDGRYTGVAVLRLVALNASFEVVSLTDGFDVTPRTGEGPLLLTVAPKAGVAGPSVRAFELRVRAGPGPENESVARGTILATRWTTRLWSWTTDPRTNPAAFAALLATPPLDMIESDALDFAWPGAPTPKVPADHLATVAETALDLPAGRWAFHITSDDGVRLLMDGKVVHEDWTWHAPKEANVEVSLSEGRHAVRIEHFELDGYATLRCSVEPVAPK